MSRLLGQSDLLRASAWSNEDLFELRRPWSAWTRSRSLGGGFLPSSFFNSPFEIDQKETSGGQAPALPDAFDSRGHIVDASTLALWRFDDLVISDLPAYEFSDSTGASWTFPEGVPGITDFSPLENAYARTFFRSTADTTQSNTMTKATSAATRAVCIGSWTLEGYVRFDALPPAANIAVLITHSGIGEASTANTLLQIGINDTGFIRSFWEDNAGVNTVLTQTAGRAVVIGDWEHLAIVKDATANTLKVYLGGALQESLAYTNDPTDGSLGVWLVGVNEAGGTQRFEGAIRELALHSVARPDTWIEESYHRMTVQGVFSRDASTHMVLSFGDTPSSVDIGPNRRHAFVDSSANRSKTYTSASLIADAGHGAGFNSSYITAGFDHDIRAALLADFTFACWYRPIILPSPAGGVFHFGGTPASEAQEENRFEGHINSDGSVSMTGETGAGANPEFNVKTPAGAIQPGERYHIAFRKTMTGPTFTAAIFVNGVKAAETTGNTNWDGATNVETAAFLIGAGSGIASALSLAIGAMDDAHLSSVARTDAEILADYLRGADEGGPVVSAITPAEGSIIQRTDDIEFDVTDTAGVAQVIVEITYDDDSTEVVHNGSAFQGGFVAGSSRSVITDGFHFVIAKTWDMSISKITVTATDTIGNESVTEIGSWILFVATAPVITSTDPDIGSTIEADATIEIVVESVDGEVDTVDSIEIRLLGSSTFVEIYDGAAFAAPYLGSTVDITGGIATIELAYTGGWLVGIAAVRVTATAVGDEQGVDSIGSWFFDEALAESAGPEPVPSDEVVGELVETLDITTRAINRLPEYLKP